MTGFIPPSPPFKITSWLLSVAVLTAVIGGIFGALVVLFIPEGVFNIGPDPVAVKEEQAQMQEVHSRVAELERQLKQGTPAVPPPAPQETLAVAPEEITTLKADTSELKNQIADLQTTHEKDDKLNYVMIGLAQLKNAYDNDDSLQNGIAVLRRTISDAAVQDNLAKLQELTTTHYPSKQELLDNIQQLRKANDAPPAQKLDDKNLTWKKRAQIAFGQFVTIRPTQNIQQNALLEKAEAAIGASDFAHAGDMIRTLPETAEVKLLQTQIDARMQVQNLMQKTTSQITEALSQPQGSLY